MMLARIDRYIKLAYYAVAVWGMLTTFASNSTPAGQSHITWLSMICGFSFLGFCGNWFFKSPQRSSRVLAIVGLGCSLIFFRGPGIESAFTGQVLGIVRSGIVLTGFAAMLHFLLLFPQPGPFVESSGKVRAIYVPAFLLWMVLIYRAFYFAEPSDALNVVTYVFTGILMGGYILSGIIVFLRRYVRTPKGERGAKGLNLMLFGSLAGFAPAAIGYMPALSGIPGNENFFVSLMLLPLVWTRAAILAAGKA
jgi:hypothetical protein